jgi:hypothetical protein
MDALGVAEGRERVTKWIEETRQLFGVLPDLLGSDSQLNERVTASEREIERLRKELDDLRRENLQLRGERDEIAQAMTLVAQRLGFTPRKSPFERTHAGDHLKPAEPPKAGEAPKAAEVSKPGEAPKTGEPPKTTDRSKG